MTVDECVVADRRGKVARSFEKLGKIDAAICAGTDSSGTANRPFFGTTDGPQVARAVSSLGLAFYQDTLGSTLESVIVSRSLEPEGSRCRLRIAGDLKRCLDTILKTFTGCKKVALRTEVVDTIEELALCLGDDPSGKIAKVCDPIVGRIRRDLSGYCLDEGVDLTAVLGHCGGADPATVATCLNQTVRCHGCRAFDLADALFTDCDFFDDGLANLSCP